MAKWDIASPVTESDVMKQILVHVQAEKRRRFIMTGMEVRAMFNDIQQLLESSVIPAQIVLEIGNVRDLMSLNTELVVDPNWHGKIFSKALSSGV